MLKGSVWVLVTVLCAVGRQNAPSFWKLLDVMHMSPTASPECGRITSKDILSMVLQWHWHLFMQFLGIYHDSCGCLPVTRDSTVYCVGHCFTTLIHFHFTVSWMLVHMNWYRARGEFHFLQCLDNIRGYFSPENTLIRNDINTPDINMYAHAPACTCENSQQAAAWRNRDIYLANVRNFEVCMWDPELTNCFQLINPTLDVEYWVPNRMSSQLRRCLVPDLHTPVTASCSISCLFDCPDVRKLVGM